MENTTSGFSTLLVRICSRGREMVIAEDFNFETSVKDALREALKE